MAFSVALISCKNKTKPNEENAEGMEMTDSLKQVYDYYNQLLSSKSSDGIFRNVHFDQPIAAVKESESSANLTLTDEEKDFLQYELDLLVDTSVGNDYAMLKYLFDQEDRLYVVTLNYYIQDTSKTNALFDVLSQKFTDKYEDYYIDSDGYTVWESEYKRPDSSIVIYDIAIRKLIMFEEPGITVEYMRFGAF
jgi:hypothetical protein